jgi:two-component system response regulator YesN
VYKIIFLDDELITLRMLESAIDWQKYGVALSGTASDGEEGIELFRQVEPDIVIADIRMPKMNGIEFTRAIRETQKKVKILLLSAYAEFEYAQSALTYQISDYLLKPLDEDKLEAAIERIVHELDRDHTVISTIENYRLERMEKQLQQLFLRQKESPNAPMTVTIPDEILELFEQANVLLDVIGVTEAHESHVQTDIEGMKLLFRGRLGSQTFVVPISPVELIVLTTSRDLPEQLEVLLNILRVRAETIMVGVSSTSCPFNLDQAFHQAEIALFESFYSGKALCFYSGEPPFSSDISIKLADFDHAIVELVEQGKSVKLSESLQDTLADLFRRRLHPALLIDFVFDLFDWIKLEITKQYPDVEFAELSSVDRNRLRTCATQETFIAYVTQQLQTIGNAVKHLLLEDPGYYIIQRAKNYARAHYTEPQFSLQAAADHVGLSKNHLSRVFHETTGMKFWDYVTQLRIEKAKELLRKSNRSNSEISREIGYESEFYFSKIFKRVVGVAAQEFRRL